MNQLGEKQRCRLEIVIFFKGNNEVVVETKSLRGDGMPVNLLYKILEIRGGKFQFRTYLIHNVTKARGEPGTHTLA